MDLQSPVTGMEPSMRLSAVSQAGASMICRSGNRGRHKSELAVHDVKIMMISAKEKKKGEYCCPAMCATPQPNVSNLPPFGERGVLT